MNMLDYAADGLKRNQDMLNMTLADFTDADMLVRPCPGANHTAWQLGHLIAAETAMFNGIKPGSVPELPAGFADKFGKENSKKDDAAFFPKKAELLDLFNRARTASINTVKTLTPADLAKPAPKEMQAWVPTNGHIVGLAPSHVAMHVGQMQVIRRKLGKPILF